MKTKLTLTVDENLIPMAKRYAGIRRMSLSQIVETTLMRMTGASGDVSFSRRWRGRFAPLKKASPRYKALSRRYL